VNSNANEHLMTFWVTSEELLRYWGIIGMIEEDSRKYLERWWKNARIVDLETANCGLRKKYYKLDDIRFWMKLENKNENKTVNEI
jgi:hypothetical protein